MAVPAFNFAFARGEPFDPQSHPIARVWAPSPSTCASCPEARRTPHPLQSLAVVGRYAADLAGRDTLSAFDPGSAFERMLELDFKLLLLGAEHPGCLHVPLLRTARRSALPLLERFHRAGTHTVTAGRPRTYRMFVRDLQLDPQI